MLACFTKDCLTLKFNSDEQFMVLLYLPLSLNQYWMHLHVLFVDQLDNRSVIKIKPTVARRDAIFVSKAPIRSCNIRMLCVFMAVGSPHQPEVI